MKIIDADSFETSITFQYEGYQYHIPSLVSSRVWIDWYTNHTPEHLLRNHDSIEQSFQYELNSEGHFEFLFNHFLGHYPDQVSELILEHKSNDGVAVPVPELESVFCTWKGEDINVTLMIVDEDWDTDDINFKGVNVSKLLNPDLELRKSLIEQAKIKLKFDEKYYAANPLPFTQKVA